ncbi:unnamed protein product [Leuciscus chuanchicus]
MELAMIQFLCETKGLGVQTQYLRGTGGAEETTFRPHQPCRVCGMVCIQSDNLTAESACFFSVSLDTRPQHLTVLDRLRVGWQVGDGTMLLTEHSNQEVTRETVETHHLFQLMHLADASCITISHASDETYKITGM